MMREMLDLRHFLRALIGVGVVLESEMRGRTCIIDECFADQAGEVCEWRVVVDVRSIFWDGTGLPNCGHHGGLGAGYVYHGAKDSNDRCNICCETSCGVASYRIILYIYIYI